MPPCIYIPRILNFNMDKTVEGNGKTYDFNLDMATELRLNPFFALCKVTDFP